MSKYKAKTDKKQDRIDKCTKKKGKNVILAYSMEKLVSENLMSENILQHINECNSNMMIIADESKEKKKQQKKKISKNLSNPIGVWKNSSKDALPLTVMMAYLKQDKKKE